MVAFTCNWVLVFWCALVVWVRAPWWSLWVAQEDTSSDGIGILLTHAAPWSLYKQRQRQRVVPFWFFWKSPPYHFPYEIMQMVWPFKPLHCVNFLFTQLPHALCEFDNCLTKLSDVKKGESSCVGISLFRACLIFRILCELDNQELWWWQKCQPFRMSSQLTALC